MCQALLNYLFFFFNDTATTEIYTLSLHDALPISSGQGFFPLMRTRWRHSTGCITTTPAARMSTFPIPQANSLSMRKTSDRKSTRLNSSHSQISYAVFCLKKKKHTPDLLDVPSKQY